VPGAVVLQDKHGAGLVMGAVWIVLGLLLLRIEERELAAGGRN
jgi:hypothetical protein